MSILDNQLKNLEKFLKQNSEVLNKDEFKKTIEKEMTNFYVDKNYFYKLFELFKNSNLEEFATKAQSIYFAHKAVEYRDMIKTNKSIDEIKEEFDKLCELFNSSITKQNFIQYIKTHSLLNNIDITKNRYKCKQNLAKYLKNINWSYKYFLYTKLIKNIIKLDMNHTKASVIIISNGEEDYILDTLKEIKKQKTREYKIVFVSNNNKNQTKKVLNLVDTFVQMRENNGAYLARNVGSIFAFSEILIFLEDDGIPKKDFVKNHLKLHKNDGIVSVRGCYLSKTNGTMPSHYWLGISSKPAVTMLEGNCSFKSKHFYEIGGWGDYIMFGHGGVEICHRMLQSISKPIQHIYSPKPTIYHDFTYHGKDLTKKFTIQHASWQILKFSYDDFHNIMKKWN